MIYFTLFYEFFTIGLFTFGGGYAMIPLVAETVTNHNWLTETQFYDFLGVCESTPGPIAINMATYVGSTQGGLLGSILATLGVVMPSFIIIFIIASILKNFTENKYVKSFIKGVKPVITALIMTTGLILLAKTVGYVSVGEFSVDYVSIAVFALIILIWFLYKKLFGKKLSTVPLILISAVLGIVVSIVLNMLI